MTAPLLFVSGEYPPDVGGVGDYTEHLRATLSTLGWQSGVLSRRQVRRWDARSLVELARAAPRTGIVHIQYQAGAYDLLGDVCLMPSILRRFRPHIRVVTTFHDARPPYLFPKAGLLRAAAVRLLARSSHAVIAADARDLAALAPDPAALGGPARRFHHVPIGPNVPCAPAQGYDRAAFRTTLGLQPDTLALVYFGLRNASKGLDVLLDAVNLVLRQRPDTRLMLLGGEAGASDRTDRQTADRLRHRLAPSAPLPGSGPGSQAMPPGGGLGSQAMRPGGGPGSPATPPGGGLGEFVLQTGWLPPEQLSAYLVAADIAVLPYADGASPRRGSLLACAEHGLPIVSTAPAAPEVADAVYAVSADPRHLAEAILHLAESEPAAARLRAAARSLAARSAWPTIAAAHVEIYEHLLSR